MIKENLVRQLHDKSTRGQVLSVEEQAILDDWYVAQDKLESHMLSEPTESTQNSVTIVQEQIDAALEQFMTMANRIQEIITENEELKHEIAVLKGQIVLQASKIKVAA